jgi:hypothetical protein
VVASSLGEPDAWPQALKIATRLLLNSGHPMYVWWEPDLLCFYNDAYCRTLGPERHPGSLGQPGREVWAEIWHLIGHQVDFVTGGEGLIWEENRLVPITRSGDFTGTNRMLGHVTASQIAPASAASVLPLHMGFT